MNCTSAPAARCCLALLLGAALASATLTRAATLTWTGQFAASQSPPGSQGSDSFAARSAGGLSNWAGNLLPGSGDDLVFGQAGFTRPVNTSARTVGSLVFDTDASAYTISGSALALVRGLSMTDSQMQLAGPVEAGGASFEMRLLNSQRHTVDTAPDSAVNVYAPDTLIELDNSQARFTTLAVAGQRSDLRLRGGSGLGRVKTRQ